MLEGALSGIAATQTRQGVQDDEADDQPLDVLKATMRELVGSLGDRFKISRRKQKYRKPTQPKHRPAVGPLETMIGNGLGGDVHGCDDTRGRKSVG
jgi:hypothetical protein